MMDCSFEMVVCEKAKGTLPKHMHRTMPYHSQGGDCRLQLPRCELEAAFATLL